MVSSLPPGLLLILGGLLLLALPLGARRAGSVLLPLASFAHLLLLRDAPSGQSGFELFHLELTPVRIDKLSLVWGYVFHIAAGLSAIYAWHVRSRLEVAMGAVYAGTAIAAAFAGDLLTLFVYWELTALSSVFLIWVRKTRQSERVAARYLIIQVASGVLLLCGAALRVSEGAGLSFGALDVQTTAGKVILLAFGIKAAFPLLHNWLQDAYPSATVSGSVVLSAFTTKLAIYCLARGYAGTELLIPIGIAMTLFPIVFAVIENDLRRVLAYSLNNQLGYMVVGIGVGTEMALNGTAAHAFAHIIYKGLLFMAMGAVLYRTGTIRASELGGLHKSMPWTTFFCIIGSLSISGFPLFSGFVTKSMTLTAVADNHLLFASLALLVASAGVVDHSGIKIPFFAFFASDNGWRVKEAPGHMLLAMALASALCVAIGVYPQPLYAILPYEVDYAPYTADHLLFSSQLLLFAALAFAVLWRLRVYPLEIRAVNLDTDWLYRKGLVSVAGRVIRVGAIIHADTTRLAHRAAANVRYSLRRLHQPPGALGEPWTTNATTLWAAALLGTCLLLYYF